MQSKALKKVLTTFPKVGIVADRVMFVVMVVLWNVCGKLVADG
jgi:hypothetical protein